jgi:hypothetical protein
MLLVHWNEDKEGCLSATWLNEESAERRGFVETVEPIDDELFCDEEWAGMAWEPAPDARSLVELRV